MLAYGLYQIQLYLGSISVVLNLLNDVIIIITFLQEI